MADISKSAFIEQLCDSWIAAASQPGGGLALGPATERFRLRNNGIVFHELSFEELQTAFVALTRVLLQPGLNTIIDTDHLQFWAWIAQLLLVQTSANPAARDREVKHLLALCVRAALAPSRPQAADRYTWELQRQIDQLVPFHLRELGHNAHSVLSYLSFPALEGVLKLWCSTFVDLTGKVIDSFSVPDRGGGATTYDPSGRSRCNSVRDLLLLFHSRVGSPSLIPRMDQIRAHIAALQAGRDGFDILYDWRNSSLHGETGFPTIGGTVLNLALLISFEELAGTFEVRRAATLKQVEWESRTSAMAGHRGPWSFYPPW